MKRLLILCFAIICYMVGLAAILYYAGFLAELWVPRSINSGTSDSLLAAFLINTLLLVGFGLQHSVMARKRFKRWMQQWVPAAAERSVYILMSSIAVALICWFWKPLPYEIYDVRSTVWGSLLTGLYGLGWFIGLFSTFLIDHFDLFGLKQAWYNWKGKSDFMYQFRIPLLYKMVRHPIYLGWLIIHWFTPHMTAGHLMYASLITLYIYIAIYYEERDLLNEFGDRYQEYQQSTPKLIPIPGMTKKGA